MDIQSNFPDQFMAYITSGGEVDPKVREVYKALYEYASSQARADWIKHANECKKAALENEFFTEDEKDQMRKVGQEPHAVNRLVLGLQGSSAVATAQRPDIKVNPLRESDPYLAELIKSGLEHVWLKNFGNDVVYDFVESRNLTGIGAVYARRDGNKGPFGAVVFEEDDVELWYWSEASKKRDRSDTHLIKAQLRSFQYIRDNYDLKEDEIAAIGDDYSAKAGDTMDTKTGKDNYTHGKDDAKKQPPETSKKRLVWEIEAHMLRTEKEHWVVVTMDGGPQVARLADVRNRQEAMEAVEKIKREGYPGKFGFIPVEDAKYWERRLNNRYMRIIVGDKLIKQPHPDQEGEELEEIKNFLGLDSDGDPVLPVVFYYGQRLSKAYYNGPTFYAMGPNKSLCKRETQYTLAISKNLTAPIQRDEHGTRWRDAEHPDAPGNEILLSTGAREATRLQPGVIDFAALSTRIIEDKNNIDDAYSLPEVQRGKIPEGLERMSGRLSLALQNGAMLMHNPSIKGLESSLERLGKTLLAIMLKSWPRVKWESLVTEDRIREFIPIEDKGELSEDEKTEQIKEDERRQREAKWAGAIDKLEKDGLTVVDFNVNITAGSSLPTNRMLKEEIARENYKIGLYDRKAALEYSGDPHAKETAERMDKREMELAQLGAKVKRG